ncbi:glycyl-radical enzyme activating protein [Bacteroides ovatus]|jgi:pyruvate formate lyase activating enzyme|uniref:glycyl-radical enzyme activating protein n=1 Tax=Bacteroides ovatus TaxID=28116 RepID=UPI0032C04783
MYDNLKGSISHIQEMSIHDGDGIRTTVFLKGCDLRCKWCHNPETFSIRPQLEWIQNKCIGCNVCLEICPTGALALVGGNIRRDLRKCSYCLACVNSCYMEAHHLIGEMYTVDELCDKIEADQMIYAVSNGGVTISGGEPMVQYDFLLALVKELHRRKINVCIQTNLNTSWEKYKVLLPYIDYLMCDFKHIDPVIHRYWTGHDNRTILNNIRQMDQSGVTYCLRTPVIPGVNDDEETLRQMSALVFGLKNIRKYELLPFHPLASYKYKNLAMEYPFEQVAQIPSEKFRKMKEKYER